MSKRAIRRGTALASGGLLAASAVSALAATPSTAIALGSVIVVDSAGDGTAVPARCSDGTPGNCTLRDAVASSSAGDTITFAPSVSHITLTDGVLTAAPIAVVGPGSGALTIDTSAAPGSYDLFRFNGAGDVVLTGLTIVGDRVVTTNSGSLTVDDVAILGSVGYSGGAILAANHGDVTISRSRFIGNSSQLFGGAIEITWSVDDFTLVDSEVSGNTGAIGGGISCVASGTASVSGSVIASNHSTVSGGGVYARSYSGGFTVTRSTIADNVAESNGGGFYFCGADGTSLTILDSTFLANVARGSNYGDGRGGAIFSRVVDTLTVANSTLTGNSAPTGSGGALYVGTQAETVRLLQDTIALNSAERGGGIGIRNAQVELSGSIVSANLSPSTPLAADISGYDATVSSNHSILGVVDGSVTIDDLGGTIRSSQPGLGALADNGGPTRTMALMSGSPAIDAGPEPVPDFPTNAFDQRGTPWRRVAGAAVDIGAFEVQVDPAPTTPTFTG